MLADCFGSFVPFPALVAKVCFSISYGISVTVHSALQTERHEQCSDLCNFLKDFLAFWYREQRLGPKAEWPPLIDGFVPLCGQAQERNR